MDRILALGSPFNYLTPPPLCTYIGLWQSFEQFLMNSTVKLSLKQWDTKVAWSGSLVALNCIVGTLGLFSVVLVLCTLLATLQLFKQLVVQSGTDSEAWLILICTVVAAVSAIDYTSKAICEVCDIWTCILRLTPGWFVVWFTIHPSLFKPHFGPSGWPPAT